MKFRLRQVEFTADGRRIARDRDREAAALTVGRSADNDIHLADLAVEPAHAVIEARGQSLHARALGTRGFAIDGRNVTEASFDPATGGELRFGSMTITVSRDGDGAVLLETRSAPRETVDAMTDKAGFSLAGVLPGMRRIGLVALGLILAAFLVFPVASHLAHKPGPQSHVAGDSSWNPGPLSLAHHALTDKCEACHVRGFESVRNETCQSCHKDTKDHADAHGLAMARGPAGPGKAMLQLTAAAFGREKPGACTDCHVEHEGDKPISPAGQQFCADCHVGLKSRLPRTELGDAGDFGTLHPDFRVAVTTNADLRQRAMVPLVGARDDNGLTFSHKVHLDPLGGVAKMALTLGNYGKALACADCHRPTGDGLHFQPIRMERDCEACHSLVYDKAGPTFLKLRHGDLAQMQADLARAGPSAPIVTGRSRPGAFGNGITHPSFGSPGLTAAAMSPTGICGECHKPEMRDGKLAVRHVSLDHRFMPNAWFDHSAHRQSKCADCHAASASNAATDVLMPAIRQCRDCHLGEQAARPKIASSCAMCHVYHAGKLAPASFRERKRKEGVHAE